MKHVLPAYVMRANVEAAQFASVPEPLDRLADVVLNYRPKPRAKRKKRKKAKRAKGS